METGKESNAGPKDNNGKVGAPFLAFWGLAKSQACPDWHEQASCKGNTGRGDSSKAPALQCSARRPSMSIVHAQPCLLVWLLS